MSVDVSGVELERMLAPVVVAEACWSLAVVVSTAGVRPSFVPARERLGVGSAAADAPGRSPDRESRSPADTTSHRCLGWQWSSEPFIA